MPKRIRLIIVEDNRLLREGLNVLLKEQPEISVVAALSSGEALMQRKRLKPDVILLDFVLRSRTSLRLVRAIRQTSPHARVIIMDLASIQPSLVEYVQAGVAGFVLKDATFQEFLLTIREVARERWSSRASSPHPPSPRLRLMLPRPAKETHSGLSG